MTDDITAIRARIKDGTFSLEMATTLLRALDEATSERDKWEKRADLEVHIREYFRKTVVQIGEILGDRCYIMENGSRWSEPFIPMLVETAKAVVVERDEATLELSTWKDTAEAFQARSAALKAELDHVVIARDEATAKIEGLEDMLNIRATVCDVLQAERDAALEKLAAVHKWAIHGENGITGCGICATYWPDGKELHDEKCPLHAAAAVSKP